MTQKDRASEAEKCEKIGGSWHFDHCHEATTIIQKPIAVRSEAPASDEPKTCNDWNSPIHDKYRVTDCIGSRRSANRNHAGVDMAGRSPGMQPKIYSVGPGKIMRAGWMGGYGCTIWVQHENCPSGLQDYKNFAKDRCISFYAHLATEGNGKCPGSSRIGSSVNSCSAIAKMGGTGGSYPIHLHFEFRVPTRPNIRINPIVALTEIANNKNNMTGQKACHRSRTWLAASAGGHRTHDSADKQYTDRETRQSKRQSTREQSSRGGQI